VPGFQLGIKYDAVHRISYRQNI